MNAGARRICQTLFAIVFLLAAVWAWGQAGQWLLRSKANHLLSDTRSLKPGQSGWPEVEQIMTKWSRYSTSTSSCTAAHCKYEIDVVQNLPPIFVGKGPIARFYTAMGLRTAAVRAGLTVNQGVLTSKWFGEQVTVPVSDWDPSQTYVPYLSVSSRESAAVGAVASPASTAHPMRLVRNTNLQTDISFSALEPADHQTAFFDFRLACITRLRPCEKQTEILPEGIGLIQSQ